RSLALALFLASSLLAQDSPILVKDQPIAVKQFMPPFHASYITGHLVSVPYILDGEGVIYRGDQYVFMALQLPVGTSETMGVDYMQSVPYLSGDGYYVPGGATILRTLFTSEADDEGWLLLPLLRTCSPDVMSTTAGEVTVCPPRDFGGSDVIGGCLSPQLGIAPLWAGTPP